MTTTRPRRFETVDWYDTPRLYDMVFDPDTDEQADFLEAVYEKHASGRGKSRALEPACGSGRLVAELARRGWRAWGCDLSEPMLAHARARLRDAGLTARVARSDMTDFRAPGRFDLAHCLVSTFKYVLTEAAARAHLECVARSLRPGGVYVLGFHLTDYASTSRHRERWVGREGRTEVVCNIQGWPADRRKRVERMRSRLVVREAGRERRSETHWLFRTYDAAQVKRLLRSVPALEHVATYDFRHDVDEELELSDEQMDTILVLRRAQ